MPLDVQRLREAVESAEPEMLERLRTLVEIESPSDAPVAVNRAMQQVHDWAAAAGAHVLRHPQEEFGDVTEIWFEPAAPVAAGTAPLLLLGHLDTVWPRGTLAHMPWRSEPDGTGQPRLWGPGVLDMKAGVLMALSAVAAVRACGDLPRPVVLLLNPDEEVGSPISRVHTERLASLAAAVFVLEPAQGLPGSAANAAYKTARKGIGNYRVEVTGVASHAGVDFRKGHSAVNELARLLLKIVELSDDHDDGVTVNAGVIGGGTRSNVVAETAWAEVDVRVPSVADAERLDAAMRALTCEDSVCRIEVTGGMNRPPMERTAKTATLFQRARQFAAAGLGIDLHEAVTGGGSDGNFTAALGVPTLDGMGPVGEGAHAAHESLLTGELVPRTALLAAMIASS